jgi:hypothetical protein
MMSREPPGGTGTTKCTGRVGYVSAWAIDETAGIATAARTATAT